MIGVEKDFGITDALRLSSFLQCGIVKASLQPIQMWREDTPAEGMIAEKKQKIRVERRFRATGFVYESWTSSLHTHYDRHGAMVLSLESGRYRLHKLTLVNCSAPILSSVETARYFSRSWSMEYTVQRKMSFVPKILCRHVPNSSLGSDLGAFFPFSQGWWTTAHSNTIELPLVCTEARMQM